MSKADLELRLQTPYTSTQHVYCTSEQRRIQVQSCNCKRIREMNCGLVLNFFPFSYKLILSVKNTLVRSVASKRTSWPEYRGNSGPHPHK